MTKLNDKQIAAYEAKGFSRWTKGSMDRLYINPENYGVTFEITRGRIVGASIANYEAAAHEARLIKGAKVYIDVASGELHIDTTTIFVDEIRAAVEAIIAEVENELAEPETETTETDTDYLIYARENFLRENFRAAVEDKLNEVIESAKSGGVSDKQLEQAQASAKRILAAIDTEHNLAWWGSNSPSVTEWIRTH